jgi:hypothetical protein
VEVPRNRDFDLGLSGCGSGATIAWSNSSRTAMTSAHWNATAQISHGAACTDIVVEPVNRTWSCPAAIPAKRQTSTRHSNATAHRAVCVRHNASLRLLLFGYVIPAPVMGNGSVSSVEDSRRVFPGIQMSAIEVKRRAGRARRTGRLRLPTLQGRLQVEPRYRYQRNQITLLPGGRTAHDLRYDREHIRGWPVLGSLALQRKNGRSAWLIANLRRAASGAPSGARTTQAQIKREIAETPSPKGDPV